MDDKPFLIVVALSILACLFLFGWAYGAISAINARDASYTAVCKRHGMIAAGSPVYCVDPKTAIIYAPWALK